MRALAVLAALVALALGGPAAAQTGRDVKTVAHDPAKPFEHKNSGLVMPAKVEGLPIIALQEIGEGQVDVFVRYGADGKDELVTVYVYRQASGAPSVWFDRALLSIASSAFGSPARVPGPAAFVPPGQSAASGLIATFAASKAPFRSTGVAIAPLGEWLVKVRYSSASVGPEALADRIKAVLAALKWPVTAAAPATAEVKQCASPLAFSGPAAAVKEDSTGAVATAIMSVQLPPEPGDKPRPVPVWCRDPMQLGYGTLYRADGETDGYLLAISDAGLAVRVQPNAANIVAKEVKTGAAPNWSVQLIELHRTTNYVPRDRMPTPDDAAKVINEGRYSSRVTTWGKSSIEINADALKK